MRCENFLWAGTFFFGGAEKLFNKNHIIYHKFHRGRCARRQIIYSSGSFSHMLRWIFCHASQKLFKAPVSIKKRGWNEPLARFKVSVLGTQRNKWLWLGKDVCLKAQTEACKEIIIHQKRLGVFNRITQFMDVERSDFHIALRGRKPINQLELSTLWNFSLTRSPSGPPRLGQNFLCRDFHARRALSDAIEIS